MYPHRIRLRGPWHCEPIEGVGAGELPRACRMRMPGLWDQVLSDFRGRVRFERRFGYPGRIDDYERVWLTFTEVVGVAEFELNGKSLGKAREEGSFEFDVTQLLESHNRLEVVVESLERSGGLPGEVALEVRRTAFLQEVVATWLAEERCVEVCGEVIGVSDQPLEVYVLARRSNLGYVVAKAGERFVVKSEELKAPPAGVHVQLVCGATIWYGIDVVVGGSPSVG